MNRTYNEELALLAGTYQFCLECQVATLSEWCFARRRFALKAIGSGGSFTSAVFASELHCWATCEVSEALTPFQFSRSNATSPATAGFFSASGNNSDILLAAGQAVRRQGLESFAICTTANSRLQQDFGEVFRIHEFPVPSGKDRFLATNSIFATAVILIRAYASIAAVSLPQHYADLTFVMNGSKHFVGGAWPEKAAAILASCRTIVVLYGSEVRAAAVDFESKLTEAGIRNAQIADLRHFAHGRHYWLARHQLDTGVIIFSSARDKELAEATVSALPRSIPVVDMRFRRGPIGGLASLACVLHLVGSICNVDSFDPANPVVPSFGRRLYHEVNSSEQKDWPPLSVAIERKARSTVEQLSDQGKLEFWSSCLSEFLDGLVSTEFQGIVLDYDGTLCDPTWRKVGPPAETIMPLIHILEQGFTVGIASGRGKSLHAHLRKAIPRPEFWGNVVLGYYNGAVVSLLSNDAPNFDAQEIDPHLRLIAARLTSSPRLYVYGKVQVRSRQITIEFSDESSLLECWDKVAPIAQHDEQPLGRVGMYRSRHSIDIVAQGVSKLAVLRAISANYEDVCSCLCIGDMGDLPGNDFELLSEPLALSVDEVSNDPYTCWNLAPVGIRNSTATVLYLESLDFCNNRIRWNHDAFLERVARSYAKKRR